MKYNILIGGSGQLGSRYLQGLNKTNFDIEIWAYDISAQSLDIAKKRFEEMGNTLNRVHYITSLDLLPKNIDIAIITTTADVRIRIVKEIIAKTKVKYWVIEKVLAQNQIDLSHLNQMLNYSAGVWVNTPMYLWPLYQEIKKKSNNNQPIIAKFIDFKGLACNSIHYIDFVSRWNNSKIIEYDISKLENKWVQSKRANFFEINGQLDFKFDDGSELILIGNENANEYKVELFVGNKTWFVDEFKGFAKSSSGEIINASVLFQSEMTADLIESIISNKTFNLPTLSESTIQHKILLQALLEHWNENMYPITDTLPIT